MDKLEIAEYFLAEIHLNEFGDPSGFLVGETYDELKQVINATGLRVEVVETRFGTEFIEISGSVDAAYANSNLTVEDILAGKVPNA